MDTRQFASEAATRYASLPQETSELYKRHYVALPVLRIERGSMLARRLPPIKFDIVADNDAISTATALATALDVASDDASHLPSTPYPGGDEKYAAFIDAHAKRILVIDVPDGASAELSMLFSNAFPMRLVIKAGESASLRLMEYHASSHTLPASASALMREISIADGARVDISAVHNESANSVAVSLCRAAAGARSSLKLDALYAGGSHVRVRNELLAEGRGASISAYETVIGSAEQRFDILTALSNDAQDTVATLHSKAALAGASSCMLKGFAKVRSGSRRSASYVHQAVLLLEKGAKGIALPDMSIDENDVKATHAASAGPIEPEHLFYMRARGITPEEAKRIIATAFLNSTISSYSGAEAQELAICIVAERLRSGTIGADPQMSAAGLWRSMPADDRRIFGDHYKYRSG